MENGVNPVFCPVCTLYTYMREGVTLKKHLDTHPKDQLIAALVRISAEHSPATTENQSGNETSVAGPDNQELISGSHCFSPSSSHFMTAITYQHLLSSNGCATNTVIPQYISFPAILSAPGADHLPCNQAAYMQMVNSSFPVEHQQQFQLLSSVTSPSFQQPFMPPVVPSYTTHHVPQPQNNVNYVPVPPNFPGPASDFPTGHVPQELQNAGNVIPSSVSLPHSSSSSLCTNSLPCSVSSGGFLLSSVREQSTSHYEQDTLNKPRSVSLGQHRNLFVSKEIVQCSKQQVVEEPVIPYVPKEDADMPSSTGGTDTVHSGVATQANDICCQNDDQKSPCVVKDVQGAVSLEDAASSMQQELLGVVKTEEPQIMEVFLEEDRETKMEIEDGEQFPENVSASVDTVERAEVLKHEPELESAAFYPCSTCTEVFATSKLQTIHEHKANKKSKEKKNVCATCKEVFIGDSEYQSHLQTHPLECSKCGKYFYRRQNLELHLKRHLGIKLHMCTICDKAFVTKQKLTEHTNSHTGNAPIKCPLCNETFRRYSNLIQHKNRHHMKIKKKVKDFICHCGEIFHSKKKLEWHKETHDEKPKCCTYCSERFVHTSSLTRHIRKAHDCRYVPKCGREVENVECELCGYVLLKSSLPAHVRLHCGEHPYSCHMCGKNFTTKWNLQLHRWTHAPRSAKPFKCSLCKSAFFRHSDYTAHMHSHRNVRPYTCNHCGCQFIHKYNCLRHVREHEVGKSFSCSVCGKLFHRSYYLKEHLRVHSGARPFACHICGKTSSTKSNHNRHVKIHHARQPVNTEG